MERIIGEASHVGIEQIRRASLSASQVMIQLDSLPAGCSRCTSSCTIMEPATQIVQTCSQLAVTGSSLTSPCRSYFKFGANLTPPRACKRAAAGCFISNLDAVLYWQRRCSCSIVSVPLTGLANFISFADKPSSSRQAWWADCAQRLDFVRHDPGIEAADAF